MDLITNITSSSSIFKNSFIEGKNENSSSIESISSVSNNEINVNNDNRCNNDNEEDYYENFYIIK